MKKIFIVNFIVFSILISGDLWAATYNAASCSQANVSAAINQASTNDTVLVPTGNCSWSGLTINKAVNLQGAGIGKTNITLSGDNTITKQSAGIIRVGGFSFSKSSSGNSAKGFTIDGSWKGAEPVIIEGNSFSISGTGLFLLTTAGGVIIANNSFTGEWDDSFIQAKDANDSGNSWGTADSMGSRDTTGKLNHYIEDNKFYGGTNQGIDADDATRVVYRYNDLTYSSFNSHGQDTSSVGVRHWEVYNNIFRHLGGTSAVANQSWAIWIRGATGIIANNSVADIAGSYWGDKSEGKFSIRGAEDARPQGSCGNVRYPVPRQLGQNHNGSSYFTDPIYIWGNTGTFVVDAGWNWGNPCNLSFSSFYQSGRDYVIGNAKPNWQPYTYPHPLRSGTSPIQTPSAPTGLKIVQ
jgi:hypothetical protein